MAGVEVNMTMFTVYVLKSKKSGKRYVGFTSKEVETRILQHNLGSNRWTRLHKPFDLVHKEVYDNKTDAIKRERFLKSGQGRKFLDSAIRP